MSHFCFFFNDTATTEIYTLSLHDALPILEYEQEKYKKIAEDYQIVKELVFGSPLGTEGEVRFIDYECEDDDGKLISVGLIVRNSKRADIVAKTLELKDIGLYKENEG